MTTVPSIETAEAAVMELLFEQSSRANPYPCYERMRANAPVHRAAFGAWFVSTYELCNRVLRSPEFARRHGDAWERRQEMNHTQGRAWLAHQETWMLWLDPPDHGRIRSLVSRAFTPRYVDQLAGRVSDRVCGLIDAMHGAAEVDFMEAFALPLPIGVICEMLGVPESDRHRFREWTVETSGTLEPMPPIDVQDAADVATLQLETYFRQLVEDRRGGQSGDDLLGALINAEAEGDRLSEQELVANAVLLLAAGFETTTNLLGNGMLALLRNRDQWRRLVDDPSLAGNAVEELLRYDSPVQLATPRVATKDVAIGDQVIPEGDTVATVVGSGNRDPERFDHADGLDIGRDDPAPLSFGAGPHFCLGAALARLEGAIAFEALARRLPNLELVDADPPWRRSLNIHGLQHLTVRA